MRITLTGGAGFLGVRLARTLLSRGWVLDAQGQQRNIDTLTLVDRVTPPADLAADPRVEAVTGDLSELIERQQAVPPGTDAVFHLAAAVSGECEANFDLGMRSNLDATRGLLETCRRLGHRPTFVFASSVAVFGASPEMPLPDVIDDNSLPTPQNSYGIQKFIGEQLVADYTRKGFVRGRSVRLMTVSVRPGKPNAAASSFLSGIIREPLAGLRAPCPVSPDTQVALSSPARTIEGLLAAHDVADAAWGPRIAMNLPSIAITVGDMVEALRRVAGDEVAARIDWQPDGRIAAIVGSWPAHIRPDRAQRLGLAPDPDFDSVIRAYMRENPEGLAAR